MRPKRVIVSVLLFSAAPLASSGCAVDDHAPPPVVDDMDEDTPPPTPDLAALRNELLVTQPQAAMAAMAHFRPLCDAQGYPLVGNVASKGPGAGYQPSEFCAEVRRQP